MITRAKKLIKQLLMFSGRLLGLSLLSKIQTLDFLREHQLAHQPENRVILPQITDAALPDAVIFSQKEAVTQPTYVWQLTTPPPALSVLPSGNVRVANTVLCTDYWNHHVLYDQFLPRRRPIVPVDSLVAPFGHPQDMIAFGGYYDFIYLVAAKLCRIRESLPDRSFDSMAVAYPLFGTFYESELLSRLGFSPDRIYDSRRYELRPKACLLGNGGDWFYPNLADIAAIRSFLAPLQPTQGQQTERTYISRAGRRRVVNEDALVAMLLRYGFTIVDDKPRSLAEQVAIYSRASLLLGPHGASFSNLIWAEPGTQIHELFTANYAPDFFLYLAQVAGLSYSASRHGKVGRMSQKQALVEDITVSVDSVERLLIGLLEQKRHPAG